MNLQEMLRFEAITGVPWPDDVAWASLWHTHTETCHSLWWRVGPNEIDEIAMAFNGDRARLLHYGRLGHIFEDTGYATIAETVETLANSLRRLSQGSAPK